MEANKEETEINEQEESANALTTSLFPIFAAKQPQSQHQQQNDTASGWLTNSSFTTDLTIINDAVASLPQESDTDSQQEHQKQRESPKYTIISDEFEERSKKKKTKKKRKHRSDGDDDVDDSYGSRKVRVRAKDYYFDTHGDRDNLVYGSLYRMDVPRYKLYNQSGNDMKGVMYRLNWRGGSLLENDGDIDALDSNLKSAGRYWSAKYAVVEQHKNLKRLRVPANKRHGAIADYDSGSDGFIPFVDTQVDAETVDYFPISQVAVIEESWEDEVLRKTREFNKLTREQPHNEKVWLDFADFQDKIASKQRQKGARLQTLEKKISVLEKATELNPDNEELLLHLLKAYQSRDSTDVLMGRWEKILISYSSSVKLWKEFLHVIQGEFSRFKVSEIRKMFSHAIQALYGACNKKIRQDLPKDKPSTQDLASIQLELGLVEVFVSLCRLEWKTGYRELATALFQAELEFCLFCPSLLLSENSKLRLFEYFWSSGCPRVGEEGAIGWSTWLEKEEESRQSVLRENTSHDDKGGWTGWSEPLSDHKASDKNNEDATTDNLSMEEVDEELQKENISYEEDTETLLKQLGIDVTAGDNTEVTDTSTWSRWSQEELSRDCNQWMPVRGKHDKISENAETPEADDDDEQISRVILYEDVSEYLFSLSSEEARLSLISQFVEFFGGQITHGICTNSLIWTESILSLEELPISILQKFKRADGNLIESNSRTSWDILELVSSSVGDGSKRTDMMKFLRNALLLCVSAFSRNYILEEAILVAEELSVTRMESSSACRALAKSLLKSDRQDVLLCGVYAKREATFGNIDHARRIFDMALLSVEGLPMELRHNTSLLYFWYAEMELSISSEESSSRALHILSCLGSGKSYVQLQYEPSKLQLLVAHQGFKERIKTVQSAWVRGVVDDQSIALICSAALFEELTSGWTSGTAVLEDAFSMVLPDRRSNSYQLEFLFRYYVKMLQRHHKKSGLSKVWESILQGLQIYPSSLELYMDLVEIGKLYTTPNKLRWIFDDFCQKKPSVIATLCSLSFEMSRGGSEYRIHGLFERALSNERLRNSVVLWRLYIAYKINIACNLSAAKRIFFRAIHACPWSKTLWLDGFSKLSSILTAKELSDLQEVMREKELNLRTDIYEILLQEEDELVS